MTISTKEFDQIDRLLDFLDAQTLVLAQAYESSNQLTAEVMTTYALGLNTAIKSIAELLHHAQDTESVHPHTSTIEAVAQKLAGMPEQQRKVVFAFVKRLASGKDDQTTE